MRTFFRQLVVVVGFGAFAVSTTSLYAQEPPVPDGFALSPLLRASILVRDIDDSLKLYRDILGLRARAEMTLEGQAVNDLMGTNEKSMRLTILQSGDLVFANIALVQYIGNDAPPPDAVSEVRTGDVILVFLTNDIYRIYDAVEAGGYTVVSKPMVLFPKEDSPTQSVEMIFFDADGNAVDLIQRDVPLEQIREH